ncbi:MAG: ABC transporter permease subunit [Dehalococcoidales bacterium]|jgi:ABC-2 type transport system permease protein|nr:ABC transporter permease subunit [Dehalococcoidales bacterium]MDX9986365.1 ABC transporter permease subunit [Dehalococcoidales bacterium]
MLNIFWRTIKDRKISLAVYSITGLIFIWMYVALFPSMQKNAEAFEKMLESFPEAFYKALGIESLGFSTIEQFLAMEHFSLVWPLMAIFLLLSIAGSGLAGEIEKGTAELILSKPVSRLKLFLGKYTAGLVSLLVFTIVSIFAIVALAPMHAVSYNFANFALVAAISFLFGWAIFSMGMLFSAIFSERSRVYMACGGILLVMYVLNVMALLSENLEWLKYVSFFHYYDYNAALADGSLGIFNVLFFGITIAFCSVAGAWWFTKRDIAV